MLKLVEVPIYIRVHPLLTSKLLIDFGSFHNKRSLIITSHCTGRLLLGHRI